MTIRIRPPSPTATSLAALDALLVAEMDRLLATRTNAEEDYAAIAVRHGTLDWVRSLLPVSAPNPEHRGWGHSEMREMPPWKSRPLPERPVPEAAPNPDGPSMTVGRLSQELRRHRLAYKPDGSPTCDCDGPWDEDHWFEEHVAAAALARLSPVEPPDDDHSESDPDTAWKALRDEGLDELELRRLGGDR